MGALAATNSPSAVLLAQIPSGSPSLNGGAVQVLLGGLVPAGVSHTVVAFPTQPTTYAIEARCHPPASFPCMLAT